MVETEILSERQTDFIPQAAELFDFAGVKWTWTCHHLFQSGVQKAHGLRLDDAKPEVGDVVLVQVDRLGHHARIDTADGGRLRLYKGDRVACVFGNRYATDVYEGRVRDIRHLHLLTSSGLVGTVTSRHRDVPRPTRILFLGYIANSLG